MLAHPPSTRPTTVLPSITDIIGKEPTFTPRALSSKPESEQPKTIPAPPMPEHTQRAAVSTHVDPVAAVPEPKHTAAPISVPTAAAPTAAEAPAVIPVEATGSAAPTPVSAIADAKTAAVPIPDDTKAVIPKSTSVPASPAKPDLAGSTISSDSDAIAAAPPKTAQLTPDELADALEKETAEREREELDEMARWQRICRSYPPVEDEKDDNCCKTQ